MKQLDGKMSTGMEIGSSNISENNGSNYLPQTGYLRIWQILGDPKSDPPIPPIIPISRSNWWAGVKSGRYPRPVKLSPRCTAWKVEDIKRLMENLNNGEFLYDLACIEPRRSGETHLIKSNVRHFKSRHDVGFADEK